MIESQPNWEAARRSEDLDAVNRARRRTGLDLGYPTTLELADGSLFSACYQKLAGDPKCSLLWSRSSLQETFTNRAT